MYEPGWRCRRCGEVGPQYNLCYPMVKVCGGLIPTICPECGNADLTKFKIVPVIRVSTSKWWNPFTWGRGMWIEKKHHESDNLQIREWPEP